MDSTTSARLTYYKAEFGPGVLAPRGWTCYETYGSSGANLYVTPSAFRIESLWSPAAQIIGPGIQLTSRHADTSGRSEIARVAARVFPAHKYLVQSLIDLGIGSARDYPTGPYPADRLTYRNDRIVEFETPPGSTGLGTDSRLLQNNDPIRGVAILRGTAPDMWLLAVRLPAGMSELATDIIRQVEQEP